MTNPYFNPNGTPANKSFTQSKIVRDQFSAIAGGFDKLAPLTPNLPVFINAAGTAQEAKTPEEARVLLGVGEMDVVNILNHSAFDSADKADIRARTAARQVGAKWTTAVTAVAALGAYAWMEAGTWNFNDGASIPAWAGIQVNGAGINNTIVKKSSNGDVLTITSPSRGRVHGIALDCTGMATGNGIVISGAGSGVFELSHVQVANAPGRGLYCNFTALDPASDMDFQSCILLSNGVTTSVPQAEYRYCNDSSWEQMQYGVLTPVSPNPPIGAYHYSCQSSDWLQSNYHWMNVLGAKYENCDFGTWLGNRWEENTTNGAQWLNSSRLTIVGNKWHSNSAASSGTHDGVTFTTCALATVTANSCFTFSANQVRYGMNIAADCSSFTVNDNVFSGFTTRPVQWTRASFDIKLRGNLPSGYGINQGNPPIYAKANGVVAGATVYAGYGASSATEADVILCGPEETIMLTNMRVILSAAPVAGKTFVVTARRNAADTAHVCTITAGNFTGSFVAAVGSEVLVGIAESFDWKCFNDVGNPAINVTIAQTTAI